MYNFNAYTNEESLENEVSTSKFYSPYRHYKHLIAFLYDIYIIYPNHRFDEYRMVAINIRDKTFKKLF